jgi:hypothetical protein
MAPRARPVTAARPALSTPIRPPTARVGGIFFDLRTLPMNARALLPV